MVNAPLHTELAIDLRLRPIRGDTHLMVTAKMSTSTDGNLTIVDDMDGKLVKCLRDFHLFPTENGEDEETRIADALAKVVLHWHGSLEAGSMIWLHPSESELIIWDGVVDSVHTTLQRLSLPAAMRS